MSAPTLRTLTVDHLTSAGASPADAASIMAGLTGVLRSSGGAGAPELWRRLSKELLLPRHPWPVHTLLFASTYAPPAWDEATDGPPPGWVPTPEGVAATNLGRFLASGPGGALTGGARTLDALQAVSRADPESFWPPVLEGAFGLAWAVRPTRVLSWPPAARTGGGTGGAPAACPDPDAVSWFPGGRLNIAAAALLGPGPGRDADAPSLVFGDEGRGPGRVSTWRLGELRSRVRSAAAALVAAGVAPGTLVALVLPLSPSAVALYLAVIWVGGVVVSVPESLTAREIGVRLRVARPAVVVTASAILRGGKALPLYPRVAAAAGEAAAGAGASPYPRPRVLVMGQAPDGPLDDGPQATPPTPSSSSPRSVDGIPLTHPADTPWASLVASLPPGAGDATNPHIPPTDAAATPTTILFSSGTTGTPKAIPWSHITPLRCGVDAWASLDVRPGDTLAWPTSLGWMMGPFLVWGALLNGAAVGLWQGAPTGRPFCEFVAASRVTCLGCVPSLGRAWRAGGCTEGCDWGGVRCFGSTGEASSPDDSLWLASRARYAPVLELCGGTELAGGYAAGNLLSPWAPSTFAGPALGSDFVLLVEEGGGGPGAGGGGPPLITQSRHAPGALPASGEVALIPPTLGMSQCLAGGGDHGGAYYEGMPLLLAPAAPPPALIGSPAPSPAVPIRLRRHGDGLARLPGGVYAARGRTDDAMNLGGIKVAAVELEGAVVRGEGGAGGGGAFSPAGGIADLAAVALPSPGGGPDSLVLVVVPVSPATPLDTASLADAGTAALRAALSPLFRVHSVVVRPGGLPRTPTGKVMRRVLRAELMAGREEGRARL